MKGQRLAGLCPMLFDRPPCSAQPVAMSKGKEQPTSPTDTAEKQKQPEIKVAPQSGTLTRPAPSAPSAPPMGQGQQAPRTQPPPSGSGGPGQKPPVDPSKLVAPAVGVGTAIIGVTADKMVGTTNHRVDLAAHEAVGGHLIRKHINQTDAQLAQRLINEPNIPAATTWTDLVTAEKVVSDTIAAHEKTIQQWLANPKGAPNLRLRYDGDPSELVGHGIVRGNSSSQEMSDARIVLKRDRAGGWYVLTGFPEPN